MAINELLCGQDGLFTQIKGFQNTVQQYVMLGKNALNSVEQVIGEVETVVNVIQNAPEVLVSRLQQEALNIVSQSVLANPEGAIATILELRAAYQAAGPAAERILDNIEQFINDPLNTSLDVCNDIPNLVQIGNTFLEFPKKALQADPTKEVENIKLTIIKEYEDIFDNPVTVSEELLQTQFEQVIPTHPKYPIPDVKNDVILASRIPITSSAINLGPGSAHTAALINSGTPATDNTPVIPGLSPVEIIDSNKTTLPPPSLANPFPEGQQFVQQDFAPSKYAKNIASKVNQLDPAIRGLFAAGLQDYIKNNYPQRDINVTETYRSPERSNQLRASGIRAAAGGFSWHNFGAAMDVAIYVGGRYDDGRRGVTEYVGLARQSMQKYGLINDLDGDSGHFYVASFGQTVPQSLRDGTETVASLSSSNGISTTAVASVTTQDNIAQANITQQQGSEENVVRVSVSEAQREARNEAIANALAEGKSNAEAERLGAIAGNLAGAEALRNILI